MHFSVCIEWEFAVFMVSRFLAEHATLEWEPDASCGSCLYAGKCFRSHFDGFCRHAPFVLGPGAGRGELVRLSHVARHAGVLVSAHRNYQRVREGCNCTSSTNSAVLWTGPRCGP